MATAITEYLPEYSDQAERAVIASLIIDTNAVIDECLRVTKGNGSFFYDLRHRHLFEAILLLNADNKVVDLVSLNEQLKLTNRLSGIEQGYIVLVMNDALSPAGISQWLDILADKFLKRILLREIVIAQQSLEKTSGLDVLVGLTQKILALADHSTSVQSFTGVALVKSLNDYLEARFLRRESGKATGVATNWSELDRYTDGFQFSEQAVIAARPSFGKTAVACGIACRACLGDKVPTLIITLEMGRGPILGRMLSAHFDIPMKDIRWGSFTHGDFGRFKTFGDLIKSSPLYFVESSVRGLSSMEIVAEIRRHVRSYGVKLVLIDYLQKIKAFEKYEKRTYEVGEVSGVLRMVAQETGVAMVTLAQLNRESEKDKGRPPRLSDLADSAQIERDADLVVLIDRKRDEKIGSANLIIAKQRDGEVGIAKLWFNGRFCRFQTLEPSERDYESMSLKRESAR